MTNWRNNFTKREWTKFHSIHIRLFWTLFLREAQLPLSVTGILSGLAVLTELVFVQFHLEFQLELLAGLTAAALLLTAFLAHRKLPSLKSIVVLYDARAKANGLACAGTETELGAWHEKLPCGGQGVHFRIKRSRNTSAMLFGVIFAAASLTSAPYLLAFTEKTIQYSFDLTEDLNNIEETITTLDEEEFLTPEEKDFLMEALDELKDNASGNNPANTLEELSALENSLDQRMREAFQQLNEALEGEAIASAMLQQLEDGQGALDAGELSEAMGAMNQLLKEATAKNPAWKKRTPSGKDSEAMSLKETLNKSRAAMRKTKEAMKKCKSGKKAAKGASSKGASSQNGNASLQKFLKENMTSGKSGNSLSQSLAKCSKSGKGKNGCSNGPGPSGLGNGTELKPERGAPGRGRADAYLAGTNDTAPQAAANAPEMELELQSIDLEDSLLQNISYAEPPPQELVEVSDGALAKTRAGSRERRSDTVLPRHRDTVSKYFDKQSDQ